jgi:hypothetical protein
MAINRRRVLWTGFYAGVLAIGASHMLALAAMPGPVDGAVYAGKNSTDEARPANSKARLYDGSAYIQDVRLTPFKLEHRLSDRLILCVSQMVAPDGVQGTCIKDYTDTRHARAPRRGAAVVDDVDPNTQQDGPTFASRLAWQSWPARRSVIQVEQPR